MRSGQGGYQLRTHGGRVPVQWLIGTGGWAMFVHQPYGTFDLTGAEGRFERRRGADRALPLDLFVVGAREPAAIMAEYARLTGYPEMPPLWSLGYQQSHRTLAGREEILQEAKTFREKKLPCDTLIYLGTGFCPSGWNTDNGEFTFNPKVFPGSEGDDSSSCTTITSRSCCTSSLEGKTLTGTVADRVHGAAAAERHARPTASGPTIGRSSCYWPAHKPLFDARRRRLVARSGRRPRCAVAPRAQPDVLGRLPRSGGRTSAPFALHRNGYAGHAALRARSSGRAMSTRRGRR